MRGGFLASIKRLVLCESGGLNEVHAHWDADFDDVDGVTGIAKLLDGTLDNIGLDAGEFGTFFVHVVVVADEFQKKRNVGSGTFLADAFNPGKLLRIDCGGAERRIVEKNFDGIRAEGAKFRNGETIDEAGETAGNGFVVTGLLVSEQESGRGSARGGGGHT